MEEIVQLLMIFFRYRRISSPESEEVGIIQCFDF